MAEVTDERSMENIRKTQEQSKDWGEMRKKRGRGAQRD